MKRWVGCLAALVVTAGLLLWRGPGPLGRELPGARVPERRLVRIWTLSSIGGGQAWLKKALKGYERAHPGVMTYLRQATVDELTAQDAALPDLLLYMPGDLADTALLQPLAGALPVKEALLACGQSGGVQYGLPLCWGAYVLAIDGALEPEAAVTPAPTTLLGRHAPTEAAPFASPTPGYPLEAARAQAEPLQCAPGIPCIALRMLLPDALPPLPQQMMDQALVYARYLSGRCASAVLTTGQAAALGSASAAGSASPFRLMTPGAIVTDQVWLASLPASADSASAGAACAADLLAWLIAPDAQLLLASQCLQPAHRDVRLYAADWPADIANAALRSFTAVNAYLPRAYSDQVGWQVLQGQLTPQQACVQLYTAP